MFPYTIMRITTNYQALSYLKKGNKSPLYITRENLSPHENLTIFYTIQQPKHP